MTELHDKIRSKLEGAEEMEYFGYAVEQSLLDGVRAVLDIHKPDVQEGNVHPDGTCCLCKGYGPPVYARERVFPNGDVLLMHGHMDVDNPICAECGNWYEGEPYAYPCRTVRVIAEKLGLIAAVET